MSEVPDALRHLLASGEDLKRAKVEGFEHGVLKRLMKQLGYPAKAVDRMEDREGRFTVQWFHGQFPNFPMEIATDRVESYSIQDLFEAPTRSPVWASFTKAFPTWGNTSSTLFFKAQGFTVLAMSNSPMAAKASTRLVFSVKGRDLFVTTFSELVDVFGRNWLLEAYPL